MVTPDLRLKAACSCRCRCNFQAEEADAVCKMRLLLDEILKLDVSTKEAILFYDERESCNTFLSSSSDVLSTDVIVLASFGEVAKVRYEKWLLTNNHFYSKRKIKRIDELMLDVLEAIDSCLAMCRGTMNGADSTGASIAEEHAIMRLYFLMREVLFQDRECGGGLLSDEEQEKCDGLLASLEVCTCCPGCPRCGSPCGDACFI